jgi:hypothetical protein
VIKAILLTLVLFALLLAVAPVISNWLGGQTQRRLVFYRLAALFFALMIPLNVVTHSWFRIGLDVVGVVYFTIQAQNLRKVLDGEIQ